MYRWDYANIPSHIVPPVSSPWKIITRKVKESSGETLCFFFSTQAGFVSFRRTVLSNESPFDFSPSFFLFDEIDVANNVTTDMQGYNYESLLGVFCRGRCDIEGFN